MKRVIRNSAPDATSGSEKSERGNVAMIFALSVIPIFAIIGLAIDVQFVNGQTEKIQAVMDSTVLNAARLRQAGVSEEDTRTKSRTMFTELSKTAGVTSKCDPVTLTFAKTAPDIDMSVKCKQQSMISLAMQGSEVEFSVDTQATYGIGKLDVSFVFDSSGSMAGQRLTDLKSAAKTAIDTILPESAVEAGDVRIGMVAYSTQLNAGAFFDNVVESTTYTTYSSYSWTTNTGGKECTGETRIRRQNGRDVTQHRCRFVYVNPYTHTCVWERQGAQALTAAAPGTGAWITPVEEGDQECPGSEPFPLSNDREGLYDYVDGLGADGYTAGHLGTAWGWYLLAPEWKTVWPAASEPLSYTEPDSAKAMILMTDGAFNKYNDGTHGTSSQQAIKLCTEVKKKGVIVYTVAFTTDSAAIATLKSCASSADFAFSATNGQQLTDAYRAVAASISDLRLSK